MKDLNKVKKIQLPVEPLRAKENLIFFGSRFQIFKAILILSIVSVALLFLPFAKSVLLASIFALAFLGAKDRFEKLEKSKKYLFISTVAITFTLISASLFVLIRGLFTSMDSFFNLNSVGELKLKVTELFNPTIRFLKENLSSLFLQLDNSGTVESKLKSWGEDFLTSFASFVFEFISKIPNNFIQVLFFLFLFFFLIHKRESIQNIARIFLHDKKNNTLEFLVNSAKLSGYRAIVLTNLTAFSQALVLTLGAVIIGIREWPFVFISAFISSIVPIVGIFPVSIVCIIYAGSELGSQKAIIIGVFALLASVIDNVLRSLLTSGNGSNLNPFFAFFALIGSLYLFGFSGLFIGPFILIFSATIFNRYKVTYSSHL
jgi:predicted PurR-regulated permease PerM